MDFKSDYSFWTVKNGLIYAFPQLDADLSCGVLVVAGIAGITTVGIQGLS